jgi:2-polyprenyl-3-methyl-5-hydroxy-6-metoxy-1,4-benzoquinol methylase
MSPDAYAEMARAQRSHWWYRARGRILRSRLQRLGLPANARILEVGSGTGANLDLLAEFGTVVGLEMTAQAIALAHQHCAERGKVTLLEGRCPDDLALLGERFDLICLFDVLEHIERDEDCLARLKSLLKPGGKLMLTVPAYPWMWGPHDVHVHHQRRYTRASLIACCGGAGLAVRWVSHFNTLLFPLAVLERFREKLTRRRGGATQTPAAALNALLGAIFGWERHLLARTRMPFGLSLLVLAQPNPAND